MLGYKNQSFGHAVGSCDAARQARRFTKAAAVVQEHEWDVTIRLKWKEVKMKDEAGTLRPEHLQETPPYAMLIPSQARIREKRMVIPTPAATTFFINVH